MRLQVGRRRIPKEAHACKAGKRAKRVRTSLATPSGEGFRDSFPRLAAFGRPLRARADVQRGQHGNGFQSRAPMSISQTLLAVRGCISRLPASSAEGSTTSSASAAQPSAAIVEAVVQSVEESAIKRVIHNHTVARSANGEIVPLVSRSETIALLSGRPLLLGHPSARLGQP